MRYGARGAWLVSAYCFIAESEEALSSNSYSYKGDHLQIF